MASDEELPAWARAGRVGWTWTGKERPPFAVAPGPGQVSVWDYPRPPALVADPREVTVHLGDVELARTSRSIRLLETSHPPTFYLPRADVDTSVLRPLPQRTRCEWKGECTYFDLVIGARRLLRAAWSYERPFGEAASIAGHVAFYADVLACYVGGERAAPQRGGFYGGWITSELVGPFKGDAQTDGW